MFSKDKRFSQAQVITKASQPRRNSASPFYLKSPLSDLKQNQCLKEGNQREQKFQSINNQEKSEQHLDRIRSRSPSLQSRRKRIQVNTSISQYQSSNQEVSVTLPSNPKIAALFLEDNQSIKRRVSFADDKENDYFERNEFIKRTVAQDVSVQQVYKQAQGSVMSEEPENSIVNDDNRNDLMFLWKNSHDNNNKNINELNLSQKVESQSAQKCQENSSKKGYSFEKQSLKKYNELRNIQKEKKLDDKQSSLRLQQSSLSLLDIPDNQSCQNQLKNNQEKLCPANVNSIQNEQAISMEQMISPNKVDNNQLPQGEEVFQQIISQEPASVCRLSNSSAKVGRRKWFENNTNSNDVTPTKKMKEEEEQKILIFDSSEKPMHASYESVVEELERMKQYYSSKDRWQQEYLNNMLKQNLQLQHDYLQAQQQNIVIETQLNSSRQQNESLSIAIQKLQQQAIEHEQLLRIQHEQIVRFKGNLRIYCRIKPLPVDQDSSSARSALQINEHHKHVLDIVGDENSKFFFDHVFDGSARQQDIFEETSPYIQCALNGDQVCLIAYGQTGSGKTFTMEGDLEATNHGYSEQTGILPRTAFYLFQEKLKAQTHKDLQFSVGVIEIYCEELRDLLQTDERIQQKLSIIQQAGRTKVLSQHFQRVSSAEELLRVLKRAAINRATDSTTQNAVSSRSHCIYQIKIFENDQEKGGISIVDLAGSESFEATSNKRESAFINKSLTTLKRIITLLGDKNTSPNLSRIPYRESKLTRLLQDSLGGNSKTLVFVMVCPLETNLMQTKESLKFSSKASF